MALTSIGEIYDEYDRGDRAIALAGSIVGDDPTKRARLEVLALELEEGRDHALGVCTGVVSGDCALVRVGFRFRVNRIVSETIVLARAADDRPPEDMPPVVLPPVVVPAMGDYPPGAVAFGVSALIGFVLGVL